MAADDALRRWDAFVAKLEARLDEVLAEADAGLDEIIATEVIDPGPTSSALNEVRARLYGLQKKLEEALERLAPELEQDDDGERLSRIEEQGRALHARIDERWEELETFKSARYAHALQTLARAEMDRARGESRCSACKAPLELRILHQASNVECGHCRALNTLRPGPATAMFFGGSALHFLALEAAWPERAALRQAEGRFRALREASERDAETYRQALRRYWTPYCRAKGELTPGWTEVQLGKDVAAAVSRAFPRI